jgi:transposase
VIAALCTGAYHLSKRTTQRVLDELFGVSICGGTLANLEHTTVAALAQPVAEARTWLWAAVTTWVTVFAVRLSRRGQVAQELLGEQFWGYLVTDRWSA